MDVSFPSACKSCLHCYFIIQCGNVQIKTFQIKNIVMRFSTILQRNQVLVSICSILVLVSQIPVHSAWVKWNVNYLY
jgi:hypothetical protein